MEIRHGYRIEDGFAYDLADTRPDAEIRYTTYKHMLWLDKLDKKGCTPEDSVAIVDRAFRIYSNIITNKFKNKTMTSGEQLLEAKVELERVITNLTNAFVKEHATQQCGISFEVVETERLNLTTIQLIKVHLKY